MEEQHISQAVEGALDYMEKRRSGVIKSLITPWKKFNQVNMGGFEWHTITTIAGMSGSGKTSILGQLETGLADLNPAEDFVVLDFNFEMLAQRLVMRKISHKTNRTTKQLSSAEAPLSDADMTFARSEAEKLAKYNIHYVEMPGTVADIRKFIYEFADREENKGKGIVILLDHVLLVQGKTYDEERKVLFELMVMFNEVKKKLKAIIVILSQLNRGIEDSDRIENPDMHFPMKKDIFGGDAMYMFSDCVLVTHRPEMLGISYYGPNRWPTKDLLFWHYLKVREGDPCIATMVNNLKHNRVDDYVPPQKV